MADFEIVKVEKRARGGKIPAKREEEKRELKVILGLREKPSERKDLYWEGKSLKEKREEGGWGKIEGGRKLNKC